MGEPKIGIIISTTREGRFGEVPAKWFAEIARARDDMEFGAVGGRVSLKNPGYEDSDGRYEVSVTGGASDVSVRPPGRGNGLPVCVR